MDRRIMSSICRKLNSALGFYSIADRKDDIKIVAIDIPGNFTATFLSNYPEIPDNWILLQLLLGVYVHGIPAAIRERLHQYVPISGSRRLPTLPSSLTDTQAQHHVRQHLPEQNIPRVPPVA